MKVFDHAMGKTFAAYNVDCVEFAAGMPENSIDLSVYSPPFAHLFVYSESERDMGNVQNYDEFRAAYMPLVRSILRATKPGRVSVVHSSDVPTTASRDGVIGLYDFPSVIRQAHEDAGWIYAGRVTIWKCPVVEMTRTKAHGLLYKTFRTDASRCRPGMPDYLTIFRKPVDGKTDKTPDPVIHNPDDYPVERWQELASPVWMSINQTNVLNAKIVRDDKDERHLCPLQLDVIERAVTLYSNKGDTVFSPFMGIGSEGYQSLKMGRKFIGTELKPAYYRQAVKNLMQAEAEGPFTSLFGEVA